ncbi:DNA-3-methyladenine glycosylase family protein [Methanobacterium sp.]|uniref:DNA-3-methyladenine glycosylase family protein n=1 Tax=Methanobacterium sp. TaxID=2164 RepID=UPI003C774ACA
MILKIKPEAPFNFDLSAKIFSNGDVQIQRYENGSYWQVINLNDKLVLVTVTSSGSVDAPELTINVEPDKNLDKNDCQLVKQTVTSIFNLNFNLQNFYDDMKKDKLISKLTTQLRGLNSTRTPTFFEAIVSSIIEQQISLKAAKSIETQMTKTFGDTLQLNNITYYAFPTPKTLSNLEKEDLRNVGLSFRKAEYVIGLSKNIINDELDLEPLKSKDTQEIINELLNIHGIGVWTAEFSVIKGLHRLVVVPTEDIGLRRIIARYYNNENPVSSDKINEIAKPWGKWSGLAIFYLVIADLMSLDIK